MGGVTRSNCYISNHVERDKQFKNDDKYPNPKNDFERKINELFKSQTMEQYRVKLLLLGFSSKLVPGLKPKLKLKNRY